MLEQCPTLLLISHNRAVLNRLCTRIIEVRDGQLHFYTGNFTAYRRQREEASRRQEFEYQQYRCEKAGWNRRLASGARPAKAFEKPPAAWAIPKPGSTNGRREKKWKSWTAPGKRFYPVWNSWK